MNISVLLLIIIVLEFIGSVILDYLNLNNELKPIPEILADKFSYISRKRMFIYHKIYHQIGIFQSSIYTILLIGFILGGGLSFLDQTVWQITSNAEFATLLYFGILGIVLYIINLPWNIYETFCIEERFGLNNTTKKVYFIDQIKNLFLTVILGGGILFVLAKIYYLLNDNFWWIAWIIVTFFSVFMSMFYSNIIVPLFNKQELLPDGELRQSIEKFAQQVGFKLKNIYVINGSKRSSRANAYFTGIGPTKRIVLYDTLINELSTDQIVAVLAHEIGHYKRKHIIKNQILGIVQTGFLLFVFYLVSKFDFIYQGIGAVKPSFHLALLIFGILFSPVSSLISYFTNFLSRKYEYQADKFASENNLGSSLISSLVSLSSSNISNLNPHKLYVAIHYSHPPIVERINAIDKV